MKRGITLYELLITICVLLIVAAITYPVLVGSRNSANRTTCISNMKQIGIALELYRQNENGRESGSPTSMGFPPDHGPLMSLMKVIPSAMQCKGNNPEGNLVVYNWIGIEDNPALLRSWQSYTAVFGPESVVAFDPNHQTQFPRSLRWDNWTAIGLRLNGSVFVRTNRGFPLDNRWWHDTRGGR